MVVDLWWAEFHTSVFVVAINIGDCITMEKSLLTKPKLQYDNNHLLGFYRVQDYSIHAQSINSGATDNGKDHYFCRHG